MFHNLSTGSARTRTRLKHPVVQETFCLKLCEELPLIYIRPDSIRPGFKPRGTLQKCQLDGSRGAITLLPDDQFGHPIELWIVRLVNLFAKDKRNHVGILLDRSGFPKVSQLRAMVAGTTAFR